MFTNLKRNLLNLRGLTTKKKIVVIESDDWGSIRMPSHSTYQKLLRDGYKVDTDPYLKFDSLAGLSDFEALFEKLVSIKDKNDNYPIITANAVMGNPDHEKILQNNFENYFWEPFTTTWQRYPHCDGVDTAWEYGQAQKLLRFQCHGKEHVNVDQWMLGLQNGDKLLKKAFENQMISISSEPSKLRFNYMEGLDFFSPLERENKKLILKEGLEYFKKYFGFESKSFIASCYIWDESIEEILGKQGVVYLQGMVNQIIPEIKNDVHSHYYRMHYLGQSNKFGQQYLIRNAFFEPSLLPDYDWVSECLSRVNIAFRWGKPAIIGSHRLNFIGAIIEENRTKNLKKFEILLKEIVKKWPDVEFTSSDQLLNKMKND